MNERKYPLKLFVKTMRPFLVVVAVSMLSASIALAEQWSRFRGPNGQGISDAKTIPIKWSQNDFSWRIQLPGSSPSSPVVWNDKVFTTCADTSEPKGLLVAVDADTGKTLWSKEYPLTRSRMNKLNSYATGTPALTAERVYVLWSTANEMILAALDHDGGEVWKREFGPTTSSHGPGVSPVVVDDLVVFSREQKTNTSSATSEWIALDRRSGKTRWTLPRKAGAISYSTPCLHSSQGSPDRLIFTSQLHGITAVDPRQGKVVWEAESAFIARVASSPVIVGDLIAGTCGKGGGGQCITATRPPSSPGASPTEAFRSEDRASGTIPYVSTSLSRDGLLFSYHDQGNICCRRAATGEILWTEKPAGRYYGSPVWVDGRLYCITREGDVVVVKASPEYELLAVNPLGEKSDATPAVADERMYLRTASHLMCVAGEAK